MNAEVATAFVLATLWAVAGASSISRPRLRLGNFFVLTCWLLAGVSATGALLAVALDEHRFATWAVAAASSVVLLARIRTSRRAAAGASAEGRAALTLLGLGLAGSAGVTAAAATTRQIVEWPERVGLLAIALLAGVAGATIVVHVLTLRRGQELAIWVLGALGTAATISGLAVAFAHLLVGDLGTNTIRPGEAVAAAFGAVIVGLAVVPASLVWLTARINEGRPDRHHLFDKLEAVVQRQLPLEETLLQVCEVLRTSAALDRVEVWTVTDEDVQLTASDPHLGRRTVELSTTTRRVAAGAAGSAHRDWVDTWLPGVIDGDAAAAVSVTYAGELQGLIVAYGAVDTTGTSDLLDDVGHRLGPVMHSASLDASLSESVRTLRKREQTLRASRERLVAAADNERARIERDLHDGAQQQLVALSVNLQLARGLVRSNPDRAEAILEELSAVARRAVEELRSLSHGIFPKTLEDEGIGPALDEAATGHSDVSVRVVTSGLRRFAPEVETAVYFACNEAIANAVKHACASTVAVTLVGAPDKLVFEVVDDGQGFDVGDADSHGLANMADRIGAVDGELTITSNGGGTRVLGTVPLGDT